MSASKVFTLSVIILATVLVSAADGSESCSCDGQWGDGHQFRCNEDRTYEACNPDGKIYERVNTCKYVCNASLECNNKAPGAILGFCDKFGKNYLVDSCSADCQLEDGACSNHFPGCTADARCDALEPGTGSCDAQCKAAPTCGNGIVCSGEQCELPGTENNQYCNQSTEQCFETKLGMRDALGNCNDRCGCIYDSFSTPKCVQDKCGAECDCDLDCNDGNPGTLDACDLNNCSCRHLSRPVCGDGMLQDGEQCELPNTDDNRNCAQSTCNCSGTKKGVRNVFGGCNQNCLCDYDSFTYQCVKGACGAECAVDADCPNTLDSCSETCKCVQEPVCGNSVVNPGEECELPNTSNNAYCVQGNESCVGNRLGTRDTLGDCNSACKCVFDTYECRKGKCGAECESDADCNDGNPSTTDLCNNCICEHKSKCGNRVVDLGEQCESPISYNNHFCYQEMTECKAKKLGVRDAYGNCDDNCGCQQDNFNYICVKDICGAECDYDGNCDDNNPNTLDRCLDSCTCSHEVKPYCGDGKLQAGEQCELAGTSNNVNCVQVTTNCMGTKQGTRDSFGNCDGSCKCLEDLFSYQCKQGFCGAQCDSNDDCGYSNCSSCYNDYCDGTRLVDYNKNKAKDKLTVTDKKANSCDANCMCVSSGVDCGAAEPAKYCVAGICGAECGADVECDDGKAYTVDICTSNCSCEHRKVPHCGDGKINDEEQCELPGTINNEYCNQSRESCSGHKYGATDDYGNCDESCGCVYDENSYQCVEGKCGAECDHDDDCGISACNEVFKDYCVGTMLADYNNNRKADNLTVTDTCSNSCLESCDCRQCKPECNPPQPVMECVKGVCGAGCKTDADCYDNDEYTTDKCMENCMCEHIPIAHCGDGQINLAKEKCELPNTQKNLNCAQTTERCQDTKRGSRDSYGSCDANCGCQNDDFTYSCVKGECGAECGKNADCGLSTCNATYTDYCDGKRLVEYDMDSSLDSTFVQDSCQNTCGGMCSCNECSPNCQAPQTHPHCSKDVCGGQCTTNADCDDGNGRTNDTCSNGCTCEHKCISGFTEVKNGIGVSVCMATEDFVPRIWLCHSRLLLDDNINAGPGGTGSRIVERVNNYAFEGEQIVWNVLVLDKNGIEKVKDVYMTIGAAQGTGNSIEANCRFDGYIDPKQCDARLDEEEITEFNSKTMATYVCTFTVEPADSMYGEYWLTAEAQDLYGLLGDVNENEYWFFNPTIGLDIDGQVDFGTVRPGTLSYSDTIRLKNNVENESGVMLNMFISGTDFYDPNHSGAKCPTTNQLLLKNFDYFASNGAYDTFSNPTHDSEGYDKIPYGDRIYKSKSIIGGEPYPANTPYLASNLLTPRAEMSITMRLHTPEPCLGSFTDGQIYFWGEAV